MQARKFPQSIATAASRLILLVGVWLAWQAPSASAQSIDPLVLEQIQRQNVRQNRGETELSPVDRSREAAKAERTEDKDKQKLQQFPPEEVEEAPPSALEADFRLRLDNDELEQFGYDIFADFSQDREALVGRLGDDYVFGIGDEVVAIFHGTEELTVTTKVDSEGRLILGRLPPVEAAGRRFGDVRKEIAARVAQTLIGTEVFVSIGAARAITIQVVGEVKSPGAHQLVAMSDVVQALVASGGVKKTGSLRHIRLFRGQQVIDVDLYSLLAGIGNINTTLRDGDRIVVPPVGPTFAVVGAVLRPAIFEMTADGVNIDEALALAGGTLRPRGNNIVLNRIDDRGDQVFSTVIKDGKTAALQDADAVIVVPRGGVSRGRVELVGHVFAPGPRALDLAPTVGALIKETGALKPEPYLPFAALVRTDPTTQSRSFEAVDLLSVINGTSDVPLLSEDTLIVLSQEDVAFLSNSAVRAVVLGKPNPLPECKALDELGDIVADVQSRRFAGVIRGAYIFDIDSDSDEEDTKDTEMPTSSTKENGTETKVEEMPIEEEVTEPEPPCPEVYQEHARLLPFSLEHVVTMSGAVRRPAALPVANKASVANLIALTGGFANDAVRSSVEVVDLKYDDMREKVDAQRHIYSSDKTPLDTIEVSVGSSVRIQSVTDDQEPGAVLLTGEFRRPGTFTIQRGETLGQLIERAGGITEQAYPYGAIFTRRSVQLAQQAGFRRAARELNAALATAALKKNVDADAVKAAQELSASFATTEAPGRVVVEADPRVLVLRHDLDIVLEPGDTVFMPKRPNHVLAIGDVLNPGALQFIRGKTATAYLDEAGGLQTSADGNRVFLVYPNGVAQPVRVSAWRRSSIKVPPGSTIVVPKDTDPLAALDLTREISTILSQLALSAASFAVILR